MAITGNSLSTMGGTSDSLVLVALRYHALHRRGHILQVLVLVEMFKAHLVMIQRKSLSANPYARETEKGPRPGGAVKVPGPGQKFKHTWLGIQRKERRAQVVVVCSGMPVLVLVRSSNTLGLEYCARSADSEPP